MFLEEGKKAERDSAGSTSTGYIASTKSAAKSLTDHVDTRGEFNVNGSFSLFASLPMLPASAQLAVTAVVVFMRN